MDQNKIELSQVAPELRSSVRNMPSVLISTAWGRWIVRNIPKLIFREKQYENVRIENRTTDEGVVIRIYTPNNSLTGAALLWIHGGGMVMGDVAMDDLFCTTTAYELAIVIVSVNYRLAPEFPFPAPVDDCYAAWNWLQKSAQQLQIDLTRVAVGGQSSGGGLAASLVQRIHDTGAVQPIAQWLFCPMLDDRTAAQLELDNIQHLIWNNWLNRIGWQAFLGTEPGATDVSDYAVPARRKNFGGLPPTWIGIGDIDLFFDEDKAYADKLKSAGVDCTLEIVPGAFHGFERLANDTKLAQDYLSRSRDWLRNKLTLA
ncbi:hypothetical protein I4U23_005704 [Adineta vaga]|nr:hypothetical protein I4U23_017040 [Adineta vaga]UJR18798.1 hypothetical protein I4U23_005704 [Adineta vaga]